MEPPGCPPSLATTSAGMVWEPRKAGIGFFETDAGSACPFGGCSTYADTTGPDVAHLVTARISAVLADCRGHRRRGPRDRNIDQRRQAHPVWVIC